MEEREFRMTTAALDLRLKRTAGNTVASRRQVTTDTASERGGYLFQEV